MAKNFSKIIGRLINVAALIGAIVIAVGLVFAMLNDDQECHTLHDMKADSVTVDVLRTVLMNYVEKPEVQSKLEYVPAEYISFRPKIDIPELDDYSVFEKHNIRPIHVEIIIASKMIEAGSTAKAAISSVAVKLGRADLTFKNIAPLESGALRLGKQPALSCRTSDPAGEVWD